MLNCHPRSALQMPTAHAAAILLALGIVPRPATTQQPKPLAGIVVDTRGGARISEAQVEVIGENAAIVASARTDSLGRFTIASASSGMRLAVRRLGFAPWTGALAGVNNDTIVIRLERVATLEAMRIHAPTPEERHLEQIGFFDRMKAGFGTFIDAQTIERRRPTSLFSLLRPFIRGCTMIFVGPLPGRLDDVEPSHVAGIEIYRSNLTAPPQFKNPAEHGAARCGSIVVWEAR